MGRVASYKQLQLLIKVAALEVDVPGSNSCQEERQRLFKDNVMQWSTGIGETKQTFLSLSFICVLEVTFYQMLLSCLDFPQLAFLILFGFWGRSMTWNHFICSKCPETQSITCFSHFRNTNLKNQWKHIISTAVLQPVMTFSQLKVSDMTSCTHCLKLVHYIGCNTFLWECEQGLIHFTLKVNKMPLCHMSKMADELMSHG